MANTKLTLDVVTENLAVTLGTTLSKTLQAVQHEPRIERRPHEAAYLSTFSTAGHVDLLSEAG